MKYDHGPRVLENLILYAREIGMIAKEVPIYSKSKINLNPIPKYDSYIDLFHYMEYILSHHFLVNEENFDNSNLKKEDLNKESKNKIKNPNFSSHQKGFNTTRSR